MATSLLESADLAWQQSELDFAPPSFPRSSLTAADSWPNIGQEFPTSEILEEQTSLFGADELMSYPQASPASLLPSLASAEAKRMTVGSGRQLSMLLNKSSPLGAFSKILLESSHWTSSAEYCYVWQILDTKFACSAFQLTPLGQSIDGNGSLLWQTPVADDAIDREKGKSNSRGEPKLSAQAKLWPTPTVQDTGTTPEAYMARRHKGKMVVTDLTIAAKLWPTPTSEGFDSEGQTHGSLQAEVKKATETIGSLNPDFVEVLMMFPLGHTRLHGSESPTGPQGSKR